jgi:hypothetical protein
MAQKINKSPLNMALQAERIKAAFPDSQLIVDQKQLIWKCQINPSPLSDTYNIKLIYTKGKHPNIFVIDQKLAFFPGEKKLPHVYSTAKQWLCLYVRKARQWDFHMPIIETIIPWISEWLLHYECWLATGVWHGGGIHQINESNKKE